MEKQKSQYGRNQRGIAAIIFATLFVQILEVPIVKAAPLIFGGATQSVQTQADLGNNTSAQNHWGVVAILVEQSLLDDNGSYAGLTASYGDKLRTYNLKERVNRYAVDVQGAQDFTKSLIINVKKTDKVEQITAALEKIYLEGDGTPNEITKLSGVVTVGDVPLPVVNKQGNHFVSMFPYTDFEDKVYIYNATSGEYEANPDLKFPKQEVWHGVIKPPVNGDEGRQLLATYFDKNHLFHLGVPEFAQFDKKIFYEDLFNEFKGMNLAGFGSYLRYLAHWEDFAYLRYNKHLAEQFLNEMNQQIEDQGLAPEELQADAPCDAECKILKNDRNGDWDQDHYSNCYEERLGTLLPKVPGAPPPPAPQPPDHIATDPRSPWEFPLDARLLIPVIRVTPNPLIPDWAPGGYHCDDDGSVQDWPDPPQDTAATDAMKSLPDVMSKQIIDNFIYRYVQLFDKYLGNVNDFICNTGRYNYVFGEGCKSDRGDLHTMPALISIKDDYTSHYLRFVNDVIEKKIDGIIEDNKLYGKVQMFKGAKIKGSVEYSKDSSKHNLSAAEFVNFANHAFLGILDELFINGTPIVQMKSIADCMLYRGSNDGSGKNAIMVQAISTLDPQKNGNPDDFVKYAGCYGANFTHPERCFPSRAETPLFDINGTKEIKPGTISDNATNYRACFDFREKTRYKTYEDEIDKYLKQIGKEKVESEKAKIGLPGSPYRPTEQIVLYDADKVKITLADVVTHFGLGDNKDNDGDGVIDNAAEGDIKYGIPANDWQQIGERVLQKNQVYFLNAKNPFPNVKSFTFEVVPKAATDSSFNPIALDSLTFHKEPTAQTIKSQLDAGGIAPSIPIDNPRFVTFQDKSAERNFHKILYPNIFQSPSYDVFVAQLQIKEAELQKIADAEGVAITVAGQLSGLVAGASDIFTDGKKNALVLASAPDVKDAIKWRDMNIDEKHVYVLKNYLSQVLDPFVAKSPLGYESTYLVSKSVENPTTHLTSTDLLMRFNGNYKQEETDSQFLLGQRPPETAKTKASGGTVGGKEAADAAALQNGIPVLEWFPAMLEWVKETTAKITAAPTFAAACEVSTQSIGEVLGGVSGSGSGTVPGSPESAPKPGSAAKPGAKTVDALSITPGEPAALLLDADSRALRNGGLSNTMVHARLVDKDGNLENQSSNRITLTVEGPGSLDVSQDEDTETAGIQITSVSGVFDILLTTAADPGTIKVLATYSPEDSTATIKADLNVVARNDLKLVLIAEKESIPSDFKTLNVLNVNVVDGKNNLVSDFSGTAKFILENPALGSFVTSPEQKVTNGIAKNIFQASNLAGEEKVTLSVIGFDPVSTTIKVLPKEAKKILLESSKKTIESSVDSTSEIIAKLYDTDDNFASGDSTTLVTFKLTDDTKAYATFDGVTAVQAKNGEARITLRGTTQSGPVNVVASAPGLVTASTALEAVKLFHAQELKDLSPRTLFAALLGSDYGNVFDENYLGGWFVFSGTTESAVSLLTPPKSHLKLANVDANGKVSVFDDGVIEARVASGNSANVPNRIILKSTDTHEDLAEIFTIYKPVPQTRATIVGADGKIPETQEGLAVKITTENSDYSTAKVADGVAIVKHGNEVVRIYDSGSVKILDNSFKLEMMPSDGQKFATFTVIENAQDIAQFTAVANMSSDVKLLGPDFRFDTSVSLGSGTYYHQITNKPQYRGEKSFSGNSSANPRGMSLADTTQDLPKSQAPGFSFVSLDSAPKEEGVGFDGDNKFMLLFSAGNSVGESNLPYAAESGVVLGDPTVRLNNRINVSKTGFTKDIGKEVYFGDETAQEMTSIDYNGDGLKDILVAYKNGDVRLLQNNRANPKFEDKGIFLNFPSGILSMTAGDINHDGLEDLIVASKDSCRKGEVCINEYENHHGNFVLKNLDLKPFTEKNRVFMIRAADMNNDGYADLVTSDDSGTIRVFYNIHGTLDENGQYVGGLGLHIDNTANLKTEVLVAYDGMPTNDPGKTTDDQYFADLTAGTAAKTFVYLDGSPSLVTSEKRAADTTEPLNVLAVGDVVKYTITLKNTAAYELKNLGLADIFPANMEVQKSSITCVDCGSQVLSFEETGQSLRPFVIGGFTIPTGKSRTITYTATVKETPPVKITLGKNLTKSLPTNNFAMIAAAPDKNSSGRMTFYYATALDPATQKVSYQSFTSPPPGLTPAPAVKGNPISPTLPPTKKDFAKDSNGDGIPDNVQELQKELTTNDKDGDGIPNLYDDLSVGLDSIADTTQGIVKALTCGKGCIPMPINFAFLAPGVINVLGVPGGLDPGLPVFGWAVPSLIPTWPPSPYQGSLGGRIYLSPTLTASLGMGICLGPYLAAQCYAFKVPIDLLPKNVCDAIQKSIDSAIASANTFIESVGSSVMSQRGQTADSTGRTSTGGMSGSTTLGNYQYKADISTNVRVPSFPQVITKWIEDQTSEIINKLSDLPDFYFIYPDPGSLVSAVTPQDDARQNGQSKANKPWKVPSFGKDSKALGKMSFKKMLTGPDKLLTFLNSIPLIQIQSKEVAIKIPSLSAQEIAKLQADAEQWKEDERNEVNRVLQLWSCGDIQMDENGKVKNVGKAAAQSPYQNMCDKLILDTTKLRQGVEKNIQQLQKYSELPRKILAWKNITAKYLYQIICYLDAIMQYTGGYLQKQTSRIVAWVNMIKKIKQLISSWKLIIDVMVEYQASCDKCTSSRFTLMELLLKLFAVIPSPPIIPFPKLPDFYLDVSQIQTGVKIAWPDVKFVPERIIMPRLPRITLPDLPTLNVRLPGIPVLPDLPLNLPELPDLPPLPLPNLPDIPPPPNIPGLPASIKAQIDLLKKLIKILCLIRKGLIPIPELDLKSHIEQLTERPLSPLIPIDLAAAFQLPKIQYPYVDRVEIKTILNFQIDFSPVMKAVESMAAAWNSIATDLVRQLNRVMQDGSKAAEAVTTKASQAGQSAVPSGNIDVNLGADLGGLRADIAKQDPLIGYYLNEYEKLNQELQKTADEYAKNNAAVPGDIHLVATQRYLAKNDPLLNKSLDEIKAGIPTEDLPQNEGQKRLAQMRNGLIAYHDEGTNLMSKLGETPDLNATARVLAQGHILQDYLPLETTQDLEHLFASADLELSAGEKNPAVLNASLATDGFQAFADETKSDITKSTKLFADVGGLPDVPVTPGTPGLPAEPKGLYILNSSLGINEKLIQYSGEAESDSQILFMDVNNDGAEEVIYSYGSNIYLKENYKKGAEKNNYTGAPVAKTLVDVLPAAAAVNGFVSTYANNKVVDMNWKVPTEGDVSGYQVTYKVVPDAFTQNVSPVSHKVAAIPDGASEGTTDGAAAIGKVESVEDATLKAPEVSAGGMTIRDVTGDLYFDGSERMVVIPGGDGYTLLSGVTVHTLLPTTLTLAVGGEEQARYDLPLNALFKIPDDVQDVINVKVGSGLIEVINPQKPVEHQKVIQGLMMNFDEKIVSSGGSATVSLPDGSYVRVKQSEDLLLKKLEAPEQPTLHFELPKGLYYAKIQAFNHLGSLSTASPMQLMAPSLCADKAAPLVNGGPSERTTNIYKALTIDTSKSFDTNGNITSYFLDTDLGVDSDKDGDATNDKNVCHDSDVTLDSDGDGVTNNECSDPLFKVGPYADLNDRKIMLNVVDESLNKSHQELTIHVVVPGITLSPDTATTGIASGNLDAAESEIPVSLIRDRDGVITPLKSKTYTDAQGAYKVDNLNLQDTIVLKNSLGVIVGEIDAKTGRIILKDPNYIVEVLPAELPLLPTRMVVKQKNDGQIISTLFLIPDVNVDSTIDAVDFPYNKNTTALFKGVHDKDVNGFDEFEFKKIPTNDPSFPGATEIVSTTTQERAAILDSGGNFYIFDERLSLRLKEATDLSDPVVIEILFTKDAATAPSVMGEFFIAVHNKKGVQILPEEKFKVFSDKTAPLPKARKIEQIAPIPKPPQADVPFGDVSKNNPYYENIKNLYQRHVLDGIIGASADKNSLGSDLAIKRSEFADIMLKIFCITPRDEAKKAPDVFKDIPYVEGAMPWYYAITKEAYFQGFITGYKAEADPVTHKNPFKPDASITRAEAVKIILEALQRKGVVNIGSVPVVAPYYAPYIKVAQDLSPYLLQKSLVSKPYILTAAEALKPNALLTRGEFIAMADRVLRAYDCYTGGSSFINGIDPNNGPSSGGTTVKITGTNFAPNATVTFRGLPATKVKVVNSTTIEAVTPAVLEPGLADVVVTNPNAPSTILKDGFTYKGRSAKIANVKPNSGPTTGGTVITIKGSYFAEGARVSFKAAKDALSTQATRVVILDSETLVAVTPPHRAPGPVDVIITNPGFSPGVFKNGFTYIEPAKNVDPRQALGEGIYVIQPECNTCPCPSTIDHTADIIIGDKLFSLISNDDNSQIFSKSNVVEITAIPEENPVKAE